MKPEKKEKIYNWFGVKFSLAHIYGIFGLLVLFGYFGENESSKKEESLYTKPKAIYERQEGLPVYITGQMQSSTIQSKYIKPGKYLKIIQKSEVFAWGEFTRPKGGKSYMNAWQEDPKDPKIFSSADEASRPFHKKEEDLKSVKDENLLIVDGDSKYRINPDQISFSFLEENSPAKPDISNVNFFEYKVIGKDENYGKDYLVLYKTEQCEKEPVPGCQRVILQVQKAMDGIYTLVGDVKGDQFVPFKDDIRAVKGDLNAAQEKLSGMAGVTNFFMNFAQIFIFLGVWFCVYLLKELFIILPFQKNLSLAKSTALTAFVISLAVRILFMQWYIVWLACLGIFIYSGYHLQEEKTEPKKV